MTSEERHEARYRRRKAKRDLKAAERAGEFTNWEKTFGLMPLIDGYRKTAKASKGRTATQIWMSGVTTNARREQVRLREGRWKSRGFNEFTIKERGKWRLIQSVHISEKGIQNCLAMNCLIPALSPSLIYDNGASLEGKGTDFALDRLTMHLREHVRKYGREGGIYMFDFSGFFSNINNSLLTEKVRKKVMDERIMKVFEMFVGAFGRTGLGLGSPISQICAVFYPNEVDHLVKDRYGIRGYARYMDDSYIISRDIEKLKMIAERFKAKCRELDIVLNERKCRLIRLTKPFTFLKVRFYITETGKIVRKINRDAPKRERRRLRAFRKFCEMGVMTEKEAYLNFHSWLLSQNRGRSWHTKLNMIMYYNRLFGKTYIPIKTKTRKQKVLFHIALKAKREYEAA